MAIVHDTKANTITLHSRNTTYQMQIGENGHLLHLYYGKKIEDCCLNYRLVLTDCGFSPNSYEARYRRDISLDVLPQEYSSANSGDFRVPALECVNGNGVVGTDLRYQGHEIRRGKYALPGLPAAFSGQDEAQTLSVTLRDSATGLTVELLYGVFEDADMLTRAVIIRNEGNVAVDLNRASSLCLDIPFGTGPSGGQWELLHFHGRHCMERMPERVPLMHGIQTVSSRRGASSHHHNPFVVLMEPSANEDRGECVGIMPVYSGNHRTDVEVDQAGSVRVVSGINPDMFSWRLAPGECFVAPEAILCWTDAGLNDLSGHYHRFIRRHIMRSVWKDRPRPVVINNWEAMTFNFTSEKLLDFARESAALGIEMMVLDDGWFGKRDSDNEGLGDWTANEAKLPGGLKPLSDAIHGMGMRFGLWIEPEMVSEASVLYRVHPDWALSVPGRKPVMGRNQMVLDMGRPEVVNHLYRVLSALLRENGIDYIKWDMNRNMTDVYSRALALEGLRIWSESKGVLLAEREPSEADFENMIRASCFGGMAIAQTGTALPHGLSYIVTYDLAMPHGMACGYFLPGFFRAAGEVRCEPIFEAAGFTDLADFEAFLKTVYPSVTVPEETLMRTYNALAVNETRLNACCFPVDAERLKTIVGIE